MGARKEDLPDIWEKLVDAGFERFVNRKFVLTYRLNLEVGFCSGHAYGKSLRAVKSCVGTTWCRYGQQDSVGFAIKVKKCPFLYSITELIDKLLFNVAGKSLQGYPVSTQAERWCFRLYS